MQEKQLLAALHLLPSPSVPVRWKQLADSAETAGPDVVLQNLGRSTYKVPDIENASGTNSHSSAGQTCCHRVILLTWTV